jgi:predicted glycoside hydrolase/deacetylase ChbG (UPF0249 family)
MFSRVSGFQTVSIANLKTGRSSLNLPRNYPAVYVGCALMFMVGNPLGNPYHGLAKDNREAVLMYSDWLSDRLNNPDSAQSQEMQRLRGLLAEHEKMTLQCWCYPLRCHAEVIREYLIADKAVPMF